MIDLLHSLIAAVRERRNLKLVSACGAGTRLVGRVERRAPGATIAIGKACLVNGQLVAERDESCIRIADNVFIGAGTTFDCALSITVECDVLISYGCTIADSDNHSIYAELRKRDLADWMDGQKHDWSLSAMRPVRICKGAWIGAHSRVLKGVTVGEGAVIGMGSVVTKDVPPFSIVAGNPARVVRQIDPREAAPEASVRRNEAPVHGS
jgi:acetyltransferase-like isoleucine patch superfamily enzyme